MGKEIERKFLVIGQRWKEGVTAVRYRQAYLALGPPVAVRIRIATVCQDTTNCAVCQNTTNCGPEAFLTIKKSTQFVKSRQTVLDITRDEFEYPIPIEDAEAMLNGLCEGDPIEKVRYKVTYGGMLWEIDVFEGANEGLVVAEIELSHPDQDFERPPWLGEEVSGDPRYLNTSLSRNPYSQWPHSLSKHDKLCADL